MDNFNDNIRNWIKTYLEDQVEVINSLPHDKITKCINLLKDTHKTKNRIFVFGNGGSASNASHFVTDLGKNASEKMGSKFNILSLTDNVSWITAIGNDYSFHDVYRLQLENYAKPNDLIITLSVSGNSPNLIAACKWGKTNGLKIVAFVGGSNGSLARIADEAIVVDTLHYGRAEDTQMMLCHMLCYSFVELKDLQN